MTEGSADCDLHHSDAHLLQSASLSAAVNAAASQCHSLTHSHTLTHTHTHTHTHTLCQILLTYDCDGPPVLNIRCSGSR